MDSTWVDTNLNLNLNPLNNHRDEIPVVHKREFEASFGKVSVKQELVEELNRMSIENKKLTEMLSVVCENYNNLHKHLMDLKSKSPEKDNNLI